MYLVPLKTLLVQALRQVFDGQYPQPDFHSVNVGIEYPVERQGYPAIWVDYSDTAELAQAGVGHVEQTTIAGMTAETTRFEFQGTAEFTIVALSSLERDRLFDELVRVLAFGKQDPATSRFRAYIEDNEFLAVNAKFDRLGVGGNAAAPGTPWGTDEIIYERTISLDLIGEFVADPVSGNMLPLSGFEVIALMDTSIGEPIEPVAPAPDGGNPWI